MFGRKTKTVDPAVAGVAARSQALSLFEDARAGLIESNHLLAQAAEAKRTEAEEVVADAEAVIRRAHEKAKALHDEADDAVVTSGANAAAIDVLNTLLGA